MKKIFSADGILITIISKIGQIILVNILWLLCCLPVITIGASTAAMYYSLIKSVRRGRGYPTKEFFAAFKRMLLSGSIITVFLILVSVLIYFGVTRASEGESGIVISSMILLAGAGILVACIYIYLFPNLSRFTTGIGRQYMMSLYMSIRHVRTTLLLILGYAVCIWMVIFLPMPVILIVPGAFCYISTYLIEPVLKKYMHKPEEGEEDAWYYE